MSNAQTKLFPAWKEAIQKLLDGGLTYGSSIKRSYLIELCEITPAKDVEDVNRFNLEVLSCITDIKDTLLIAHCMLLASDHAGNYIVIAPESQTQYAVEKGVKAITKEMRRMAMNVSFTKVDLLTDSQRAKNTDAQAKISMIAGMMGNEHKTLKQLTRD